MCKSPAHHARAQHDASLALLSTGTFPRSVADLKALTASCHAYVDEIDLKRNERLVKLYRFYVAQANGKPWLAEDDLPAGQHQAVEEFNTRAGYLKTFLRLE